MKTPEWMMARLFKPVSACVLLGLLLLPATAQTESRPNVLFILVDNLGYGELGVYGGGATRGAASISLPWRAGFVSRS